MLKIRKRQMDQLEREAQSSFERRVEQHLTQFFADDCKRAGPERVQAAIRQGIRRAEKYGIASELDVARYIDLSVTLGLDFDRRSRNQWIAEILRTTDLRPGVKLQFIFDRLKRIGAI